MTVSFEGVKIGDRIRLTTDTGDFAEFTVTARYGNYIDSKNNSFYGPHWDTLEVLAPALPTKPGYYEAVGQFPMGVREFHPYYLSPSGQWYAIQGQYDSVPESEKHIQNLGRLVLLGSQAGENK